MLDGTTMEFAVRVPSVESALILKAFAFNSRHAAKDVADIYNLLCSIETHGAETAGATSGDPSLKGNRLDASRILHALADHARTSIGVAEPEVPAVRLTALIRTHVPRAP